MTREVYNKLAEALNTRSSVYLSIPCDEFYVLARQIFLKQSDKTLLGRPHYQDGLVNSHI